MSLALRCLMCLLPRLPLTAVLVRFFFSIERIFLYVFVCSTLSAPRQLVCSQQGHSKLCVRKVVASFSETLHDWSFLLPSFEKTRFPQDLQGFSCRFCDSAFLTCHRPISLHASSSLIFAS